MKIEAQVIVCWGRSILVLLLAALLLAGCFNPFARFGVDNPWAQYQPQTCYGTDGKAYPCSSYRGQ